MTNELEDIILQRWFETYIQGSPSFENIDLHQKFADVLGVSRQEAKVLCYKTLWNVPFLKQMMEDLVVLDNIRKELGQESKLSG